MKKSEVPQVLNNIQHCPLHGRKLSRYLCANANILTAYLQSEEKAFVEHCRNQGIDLREINEIQQSLNPSNEGGYMENLAKMKFDQPEKYDRFIKFETIRVTYFDQPADIKFIPIPERVLPNSVTFADRNPIEFMIKIPRI